MQDVTDLQRQNNNLNHLVSKLKSSLSEKENLIGRSSNDNDHEINMMKQALDMKKQENNQLQVAVRDARQALKDSEMEAERKRREQQEKINLLDR